MPDVIGIGPLMLNSAILIYVISIFIGFLVIRWRLRKTEHHDKPVTDLLLNMVLIVALFWKFGTLLFMPSLIWNKPLQILLLTGSWREVILGIAVAGFYGWWRLRVIDLSWRIFLDLLPFGILAGAVTMSLLSWEYGLPTNAPWGIRLMDPDYAYHPLNVYLLILSLGLLIWFWFKSSHLGQGIIFTRFMMLFGAGLLLISMFSFAYPSLLFFSFKQWGYVTVIVLGFIFQYILGREKN